MFATTRCRHGCDAARWSHETKEKRRKQEDDEVNRMEEAGTKGDRGEPRRGGGKLEKKQKARWRTEEMEEKF